MSKRDELAAVLEEHCYQGFDPYVNMGDGPGDQPLVGLCTCGWAFDVPADGAGDVGIWAAHQADAVLAWLGEQFDEGLREGVMLGIAGTQKPCRKAIRDNGGCVTDFGPCLCASETDAALAAVRARLGLSDAAQDAQNGAVGPGSVRMGTGEGADELGRNGSIQEGEA